jgi:hypothetical protein
MPVGRDSCEPCPRAAMPRIAAVLVGVTVAVEGRQGAPKFSYH